jgi:hypothetical protein
MVVTTKFLKGLVFKILVILTENNTPLEEAEAGHRAGFSTLWKQYTLECFHNVKNLLNLPPLLIAIKNHHGKSV